MKGLVTKSTGSWYLVKTESGKVCESKIRGKFRLEGKNITNPVAVGDEVEITDAEPFVIEKIYDRRNYIIRQSVKKKGQGHLLATNIDQAVLIATLNNPRTSLGFIDRFLISAEAFRIPQVLVFNKIDLINDKNRDLLAKYIEIYTRIGVQCLVTSAKSGEGIEAFRETLEDKNSLISGHSGVGKSTLLNRLDPAINQKTNEISGYSEKGKHTTTFAEMFFLSEDTKVIDTPGIKELGLIEMEEWEIGDYFPEIREVRNDCKFNNCMHINEPKCAVIKAVEEGQISAERYKSYLSMLINEDNRR